MIAASHPAPSPTGAGGIPILGQLSLVARIILVATLVVSALIALDGESNWLEGALLMIVFLILAISFFEFV